MEGLGGGITTHDVAAARAAIVSKGLDNLRFLAHKEGSAEAMRNTGVSRLLQPF